VRKTERGRPHADALLVDTRRGSETGILVRIQNPESNDPSAVELVIAVRNGPGVGPAVDTELMVALRGPDLRSLAAVIERAIETAETVGILPDPGVDTGILVRSGARTLKSNPRRLREIEPKVCAFCFERIAADVTPVVIAQRNVHPECAKEFDAWIASTPEENDPRWLEVTDATPVEFDGKMTTWGELMLTDRKNVEILPDGRLVGRYPF
jgi:hypothetical protein